ncbi:MAG: NifU family protein [Jatrophihabitantaceae bacterium]
MHGNDELAGQPDSSAAELTGGQVLQNTADRVQALLSASSAGGTLARERAEELLRLVVDLYGAGLARLLDLAYDNGKLDDELLAALAGDELVAGLLLVHGLHPEDVETRIGRALDSVRPYLASHGGDVELVELTEAGTVRLRLTGSCDGCPSSAVTLELAVQTAVRDAAPEVTEIAVLPAAKSGGLIPVADLRLRTSAESIPAGWHRLSDPDRLRTGLAEPRTVGSVDVVVCAVGSELFAFRDRCGRCGGSLAGAPLQRRLGSTAGAAVLRCPGCGAHFDVPSAGAGIDDPAVRLEPLPLISRADQRDVSVAVPA